MLRENINKLILVEKERKILIDFLKVSLSCKIEAEQKL